MKLPRLLCLTKDSPNLSHAEQASLFCEGGARFVQIRSKCLSFEEHLVEAASVVRVCRKFDACCIVNDSPEVALKIKANGVHLGNRDSTPELARDLLGSEAIIGGTVNSWREADNLLSKGVCDYAGVGPFRSTCTKVNLAPILSAEELREIIDYLSEIPSFVIGGLRSEDAREVLSSGAHGLAVCGTLFTEGKSVPQNVSCVLAELNLVCSGLAA